MHNLKQIAIGSLSKDGAIPRLAPVMGIICRISLGLLMGLKRKSQEDWSYLWDQFPGQMIHSENGNHRIGKTKCGQRGDWNMNDRIPAISIQIDAQMAVSQ